MESISFKATHSLHYYLDKEEISTIKKAFEQFSGCFDDNFDWETTDGLPVSGYPKGILRYEIKIYLFASTLYDLSQVEQAFHTMCRLKNFPYFQLLTEQV